MDETKPLLKRLVDAFRGPSMEDVIEKRVNDRMKQAAGGDVLRFSPKAMTFPGGSTRKPYPLGVSYQTLRDFADYYPIARSCIEFRKSQITHLNWSVGPKDITSKTVMDEKNQKNSKELIEFFRHPTGKNTISFTNWLKQIMEDLLVVDAVAVYRRRTRGGRIIGYLPIDGASIELMLLHDGTTPDPPDIAYVQKIHGQETARLTSDELIYTMMNPRTHTAYGLAPLETLILTVTTALKSSSYNLSMLTEGNVPEGFIFVPKDIASSRDQLKEWQDAWDAMLSGDPRIQRKLKFLPEGMKYEPTIKPGDMTFEKFEKWLLQNTCSVFGLHPSAIGFNFDINRATDETSWEVGKERSLFPTALFLKEFLDEIVQMDMERPELQFVWTNINPTNKKEEADVAKTLINNGMMAIDEWRLGEGLAPTGVKDPLIMTPVGPMFVKDLVEQSDEGQQPVAPYKPAGENKQVDSKSLPIPSVGRAEGISDLVKWKKAAINDFKDGKSPRFFRTDMINKRDQYLIRTGLMKAKSKEDIKKVFDSFSHDDGYSDKLVKAYQEVLESLANGDTKSTETESATA